MSSGEKPEVSGIYEYHFPSIIMLLAMFGRAAGQEAKPSSRGAGGERENAARASIVFRCVFEVSIRLSLDFSIFSCSNCSSNS